MNVVTENWEEIMSIMIRDYDISDVQYTTWLKPLKAVSFTDNILTISAPAHLKPFGFNIINNRYKLPLQVTICDYLGIDSCSIELISEEEIPVPSESSPPAAVDEELERRINDSHLDPRYTFETFVVGSNSKFAQAAALAVAESPGIVYNPLYIYGGAGLGKTHLMHSIGHYILEHNKNSTVLYVTSEQFTNELIETIRNGNNTAMSRFREKYRNIDVLLLDDIQFIIGKESTQEEFFHTFNALHSAKKQIILSSDKPPKDLEILEERFKSRFEWGLIADISIPDYETRMAILHKKEELENFTISEEIIQYIANNIKSNIRELEGAFNKILAHARLETKEITIEDAEVILKDFISPSQNKTITPEIIMQIVADFYNVDVNDLPGNKRQSTIKQARHVSMYFMRDMLSLRFAEIGSIMNKDHSTVMNAVKKVETEINMDEQLAANVQQLRKRINATVS